MNENRMILPSRDPKFMRLVKIPDHFEVHEVYLVATSVIAGAKSSIPDYDWSDVFESMEEHGFSEVSFIF